MSRTEPETRPSEARSRLLNTATRLFYAEGIHSVGIDRIIAEAKVTRATFYRHFPGKEDLVLAYLQSAKGRPGGRGTPPSHGDRRAVLFDVDRENIQSPGFGSPPERPGPDRRRHRRRASRLRQRRPRSWRSTGRASGTREWACRPPSATPWPTRPAEASGTSRRPAYVCEDLLELVGVGGVTDDEGDLGGHGVLLQAQPSTRLAPGGTNVLSVRTVPTLPARRQDRPFYLEAVIGVVAFAAARVERHRFDVKAQSVPGWALTRPNG